MTASASNRTYTLRIAVIDTGDKTLLVWVRDIRGAPAEYAIVRRDAGQHPLR